MINDVNEKLEELNIQLDEASPPAGSYVPYVISSNLVFISEDCHKILEKSFFFRTRSHY